MAISSNWPLLGAVRFFLAFVVLAHHLSWYIPTTDTLLKFAKFSPLVAVLGFLAISGYSIAASFEAQKSGFYFRRALRIIPIYVLSVGYSAFIAEYSYNNSVTDHLSKPDDIGLIIGNLFFLQGIIVHSLDSNPIVWTLSVEVFFYIITPFLSARNKYFLPLILLSAALFSAQRYLGFTYFSQMLYGFNIVFLGWAWLLGFWYFHHEAKAGSMFFVSGVGIVAITINGFFMTDFWAITWLLTCTAIGYGYLIKLPCTALLKKLGDISYPLYLLHIPIFLTLKSLHTSEYGLLYATIAVILCLGIDTMIDNPLKALIKKAVLKRI